MLLLALGDGRLACTAAEFFVCLATN